MLRTTVLLSWLAAAPCGSPGGPGAPDADPPSDTATRTYRLASAGVRLDPVLGIVGDPGLAGDIDVVNVHQDFFGVPWTAFATGAPPPAAWTAKISALADEARATGKDVFLALAPLAGDRAYLAPEAVASPAGFDVVHGWKPPCYDLAAAADGPSLRAAYARYVDHMVRLFAPRWVNIAVEISLFHVSCPAAWDGMVLLEREAYHAAKRAAPGVPAFPSIQIDALYGRVGCPPPRTAAQCYEAGYAALANLLRDRFAVSSFPYHFAGFDRPDALPADYLSRAAARGGERWIVAETGWLATDLTVTDEVGQCITALASSPAEQADYFDHVIGEARTGNVELINWISNRDFLATGVMTSCPCTFSTQWCALVGQVRSQAPTPRAQRDAEVGFKGFGAMGIRDHDGVPRQPIFERWRQARALPLP